MMQRGSVSTTTTRAAAFFSRRVLLSPSSSSSPSTTTTKIAPPPPSLSFRHRAASSSSSAAATAASASATRDLGGTRRGRPTTTSLSSFSSSRLSFSSSSSTTATSSSSGGRKSKKKRVRIENLGNGITSVVLSRPEKLNGLDLEMFESIADAAATVRDDESIRVVVLSGEGRAFCAGLDVKGVTTDGGNPLRTVERLLERPSGYGRRERGDGPSSSDDDVLLPESHGNLAQDVSYLWRSVPCPVIASLHGVCYGGGLQIALGADLRFATPDCRLSVMESKWGLIPDMGASVTLRELVRMDVALELTMTGKVVDGREAQELGLITRCAEDPMEEALRVAEAIVARSPDSVAASKRLYHDTWVASEKHCLKVETELQRRLLGSWNQAAASGRALFGVRVPYAKRKEFEVRRDEEKERTEEEEREEEKAEGKKEDAAT